MIKQRNNTVIALDIGSTKILCMVAKILSDGELEVIGLGRNVAEGVKSGVIVDLHAATSSIIQAVDEAEKSSGVRLANIYTNISSNSLLSQQLSAEIDILGHEISSKDLNKLLFQAIDRYKGQAVHVIQSFVYDYILDGNRGISNPLGMYGNKLACDANIVVSPNNVVANLANCMTKCQLDVNGYIPSAYASGLSCLSNEEMQIGVVLIEFGGGCSSISFFSNGQLVFTDGVPFGSYNITNDIAKGLGTTIINAERIKILHGSVMGTALDSRDVVEINPEEDTEENFVMRSMLAEIILARAEEILELLKHKLSDAGLTASGHKIVLTGGGANLIGMKELTGQIFASKARIATVKHIAGLHEENKDLGFTTAIGMVTHIARTLKTSPGHGAGDRSASKKIWQWFKDNLI